MGGDRGDTRMATLLLFLLAAVALLSRRRA
jgi:MYXO-CTERM domain-containing protein